MQQGYFERRHQEEARWKEWRMLDQALAERTESLAGRTPVYKQLETWLSRVRTSVSGL